MDYKTALSKITNHIRWIANEFGKDWRYWAELFEACRKSLEKIVYYEEHSLEDETPKTYTWALVQADVETEQRIYTDCTFIAHYKETGWELADIDAKSFEIKKWRYLPGWKE